MIIFSTIHYSKERELSRVCELGRMYIMNTIILSLEEKNVELVLEQDGEHVFSQAWVDNNDMLEQFFPRLDAMLKSHGLSVEDIDDFVLKAENPTGYTTSRIAQTVIHTLTFAKNHGKSV